MEINTICIRSFVLLFLLFSAKVWAQEEALDREINAIVKEGKRLYRSEMASWYGTDLFVEAFKDHQRIGGYFSYTENDISKCIFYSREDHPKVIGTISFDSTYNVKTAKVDLNERDFTERESDLYFIRYRAMDEMRHDTLFKIYKNSNLNTIPLIDGNERKVYVLSGTSVNGLVIFGNDYLLTFDDKNNLTSKRALHNNAIFVEYGKSEKQDKIELGSIHSHLPSTGDLMTATDICTLMLYEKLTGWRQHTVISEKYMSVWNCETNELHVVPMDVVKKIDKNIEKRKKK